MREVPSASIVRTLASGAGSKPNRGGGGIATCVCASSIQSSLPCVLRSSRGVGPLKPKCSSRVGPRCSIRADVKTEAGALACAWPTIAPMIAVAAATANILRITATYPSTRIAAARGDHHAPITSTKRSEQRQNRESRAKDARWTRILTFILSLAGRGDRTSTSLCKRFLVLGDFAFLHSLGELPGDNL